MIIPLYSHWSSPEWKRLLKSRLTDHYVILNPNDGPVVDDPSDRKGWQLLAKDLRLAGAKILIYIDVCRAKWEGEKWCLKAKTLEQYQRELTATEKICPPDGYFLDDWSPQGDEHRRAMRQLTEGLNGVIVANPGCPINQEKWLAGIKFITHETNGMPRRHEPNYIALGVAKKPVFIGPYSYATDVPESRNPYGKLPSWF